VRMAMGTWFQSISAGLKDTCGYPFHLDKPKVYYYSGCNAEMLGELFDQQIENLGGEDCVECFVIDVSKWDAHVSSQALRLLNEYYDVYRPPRLVKKVLERRLNKTGITTHGVKYSVEGTVGSGDADTSCGNSLLHMSMVNRMLDRVEGYGIVQGDDCLLVVKKNQINTAAIVNWYRNHGFEAVTEKVEPDLAEFCSGFFWKTPDGRVYGPKPDRVLSKTFWCRTNLSRGKRLRWLKEVCISLEKSCSYVPVLQVVVNRMLALLGGIHRLGRLYSSDRHKIVAHQYHSINNATRKQMSKIYGIDVQQLVDLEQWLSSEIKTLPVMVSHPVLCSILKSPICSW